MKKWSSLLLMIFSALLLAACSSTTEDGHSFTGTIEEISDQSAIVWIEEGDILASGDRATVNLAAATEETTFEVGDTIIVTYSGPVGESYPLTITTESVEKR